MSLLEAPVLDPAKIWVSKSLKHDRMLTRGQFSPCGKLVAAGGVDNQVHYWDLATDRKTTLVGHVGWIAGLAFHTGSERLFTGDFHGMLLCWPITGKEEKPLWTAKEAHAGGVSCLIVSPDGQFLISGGHDRVIRVWSPQDGKLVKEFKEHEGPLFCAAFHPDGKSFVAGGLFPRIKHWDLESGKAIREIEIGSLFVPAGEVQVDAGGVRAMALDAKGTVVACAGARSGASDPGPGGIVVDWESGKLKHPLKVKSEGGLDGTMTDIAFLSDGTLIGSASGSASGGFFFWKEGQEEPFHTLLGGGDSKRKMSGSVHQMSLHADGLRVAATLHVAKGHAGNGGLALVKKGEYLCHAGGVGVFNLYAKPSDAVELKNAR